MTYPQWLAILVCGGFVLVMVLSMAAYVLRAFRHSRPKTPTTSKSRRPKPRKKHTH